MSKHSQDQTAEEATLTSDTETEQIEDAVSDGTEKADEPTETADEATEPAEPEKPKRNIQWSRVFAYGVLPALALLLAMGAGYLKWTDNSVRDDQTASIEAMQAAKDSTIAMLSYKPDTVEQQLTAARDLLTSDFRDQYTSLTNDVVIPGAKQKQISAVATVPAMASVSANPRHAVVLVFVNQTVIVGQDAPTDSASSVRVTLDKVGDRWLIAKFDPV
jgi:Mce-associated membrane protein